MAQTYQGAFIQEGASIDYTPGSAVAAGAVVVQNKLVGIAKKAIAASTLGALAIDGVFDVVKANGAIAAGIALYWDADGNPQGGTAGTGAATATATANTFMGHAVAAALAADETVRLSLRSTV